MIVRASENTLYSYIPNNIQHNQLFKRVCMTYSPVFVLSISFISPNFFHNQIQAQVNHASIIPYAKHMGNQKPVSKCVHSNLLLHSPICTFM